MNRADDAESPRARVRAQVQHLVQERHPVAQHQPWPQQSVDFVGAELPGLDAPIIARLRLLRLILLAAACTRELPDDVIQLAQQLLVLAIGRKQRGARRRNAETQPLAGQSPQRRAPIGAQLLLQDSHYGLELLKLRIPFPVLQRGRY